MISDHANDANANSGTPTVRAHLHTSSFSSSSSSLDLPLRGGRLAPSGELRASCLALPCLTIALSPPAIGLEVSISLQVAIQRTPRTPRPWSGTGHRIRTARAKHGSRVNRTFDGGQQGLGPRTWQCTRCSQVPCCVYNATVSVLPTCLVALVPDDECEREATCQRRQPAARGR